MARKAVAVALLFIVAFVAAVSSQSSPASSPSAAPKPASSSPAPAAIVDDADGEPPVPSDEPTPTAAPTPANSAPADATPSDKAATGDAHSSASLKISTVVGATAAAGFFLM